MGFLAATLKPIYEELNKDKKKFEVIIIHGDNSEAQHMRSFPDDAPWVALPFESTKNAELSKKYSEGYVPCLYVLNFEGKKVVTGKEARVDLGSGAQACFEKWLSAVEE